MIFDEFIDPCLCSLDPVTLTGLVLAGVGAAGGAAAASMGGGGSAPAPTPTAAPIPAAAAPPPQNPVGTAQPLKSNQPSYIGAAAVPQQNNQKTLLGA
jgi:hypothetical protein